VLDALGGHEPSADRLAARALPLPRAEAFTIAPAVFADVHASNPYTVLEVNARDRAGLLFDLARTISVLGAVIHSAHIATYGERAVDVFYVTELDGTKIDQTERIEALRERLLAAAAGKPRPGRRAA
jgi:[protein-PII] uridylyltransferase